MNIDFRTVLAKYDSELIRRYENQVEFSEAYTDCPGCANRAFSWCPVCLSTGQVTRAEARSWTEPGRKVA